eukprot:1194682-Prorocentrum_minimum.AAC.1
MRVDNPMPLRYAATASWSFLMATSSAVYPSKSGMRGSTPSSSTSICAISDRSKYAAACSTVNPFPPFSDPARARMSAPSSTSVRTICTCS